MEDPEPFQAPSQSWSTFYRDADETVFAALRRDLTRSGAAELSALESLRRLHHDRAVATARVSVPARRSAWTPADRRVVLHRMAAVLHDTDLAEAAFGDEHHLRELWYDGALGSVEKLCRDVGPSMPPEQPEELAWLLDTWSQRQTSKAAGLTGLRTSTPRKRPRRSTPDQPAQTRKKQRTAAPRTPERRRGR